MPRTRIQSNSNRLIKQVWNGVSSTGLVDPNPSFSKITDVNHGNVRTRLGSGDCGGPMVLQRDSRDYTYGQCFSGQGAGSQVAVHVSSPGIAPSQPLASTLYGLGGTAISRCLPTDPLWSGLDSMAQNIGRDAIPKAMGASLWRERTRFFRGLGKEYLNLAFGWAPFVQDVLDVCHAVKHSHAYLERLHRGSDHMTRASYRFPEAVTYITPSSAKFLYSWNSGLSGWDSGGKWTSSGETGTSTWFNGAFRYHIPLPTGSESNIRRFSEYADHVLGVRLSPEVLWDVAPWSWAVDWAVNVGDVAHNIGAFHQDGLTLQYGYIMSHTWRKEVYSFLGGTKCTPATTTVRREWKVRYPASPYGFGITYDSLTLSQKAILAAIGISHF